MKMTGRRAILFVLLVLALATLACGRDLSKVDCTTRVSLAGGVTEESALSRWQGDHPDLSVTSQSLSIGTSGVSLVIRHECP